MKKFYCSIFGHNLEVSKEITNHVKEYQCKCCKQKFTTSTSGQLTLLTKAREDVNNVLENIYLKRLERKAISI